jgi:ribonuclease T2
VTPKATATPLAAGAFPVAQCEVRDEWLNPRYDHGIDRSNPDVATDFFLLVYSNSPGFCDHMQRRGSLDSVPFQCSTPNRFGWVLHGLWGESRSAYLANHHKGHPRFCEGDLPKLDLAVIRPHLCMSPGTRLLQGQWEKHGACDFESAEAYFAKARELYERFKRPPPELGARAAMHWMKENNPALKGRWLHVSGKEFGICFSRDFQVIDCPKRR